MNIAEFHPKPVQTFTLGNGFKLLGYPDNTCPIVCMQLYIKVGSAMEQASQQGYAHFLEHLVFKNTERYPDNQITYKAPILGATINAYTDFDTTCYYLLLPSEELEGGLEILSEMAYNANIRTADVRIEKDIILEEIRQYRADPEASFIEYIQNTYFLTSPLKNPVLGNTKTLGAATPGKLRDFYRSFYRPENAFLVVTGDIEFDKLQETVSQHFSVWDRGSVQEPKHVPAYPETITFRSFSRGEAGQELLAIAIPELDEKHPDSEALHIAIRHLAIGKSSLLYKSLVEELSLCSNVKVSSLSGLIPGISVIMMYPLNKRFIPRILSRFQTIFDAFIAAELDSNTLRLVKNDILHGWIYSFEGVENLANLVAAEEFNGDLTRIITYGRYIESISATQVSLAVRKHWQWNYLALYHQGKSLSKAVMDFLPQAHLPPTLSPPSQPLQAYHMYTLSGGMKVVYHYQPSKPVCGFALSSHLSQLCEPQPGVNYFTSGMMLYATQTRSHDEILNLSRELGFNIRLIHHLDSTTYRGKCHQSDLYAALELLSELLNQPRFDRTYLGFLKHAAMDSLRRDRDYPPAWAYRNWFEQLYGRHNNLFYATGTASQIQLISLEAVEAWYDQWEPAHDFTLCVTAAIDPDHFYEMTVKLFDKGPSKQAFLHQTPCFDMTSPGMKILRKGLDQAVIHIGGHACSAHSHLENSAFHVLAQVLGGDLSSRMFYLLREKYGYAYQCGFEFSSIRALGYWYAYAMCDAHSYRECLKLMQEILNDVSANGITEDELDSAQKYLIGMSRFDHESVAFRASSIANLIALGYDLDFYLNREQRIKSVSAELIRDLAATWLSDRYINVLV